MRIRWIDSEGIAGDVLLLVRVEVVDRDLVLLAIESHDVLALVIVDVAHCHDLHAFLQGVRQPEVGHAVKAYCNYHANLTTYLAKAGSRRTWDGSLESCMLWWLQPKRSRLHTSSFQIL